MYIQLPPSLLIIIVANEPAAIARVELAPPVATQYRSVETPLLAKVHVGVVPLPLKVTYIVPKKDKEKKS